MDHRAELQNRSVAGPKRLVRRWVGVALWGLLVTVCLFLGFRWNHLQHRQVALQYLKARHAKIEVARPGQDSPWAFLAPLVGEDSLTQLRTIDLSLLEATDSDLAQAAMFTELTELHIQDCPVSEVGAKHLRKLSSLRVLNLARTKLGEAAFLSLPLDQLVSLDISGTNVSDRGIARVAQLGSLKRLHARNCLASDEALGQLARAANLQELDLSGGNASTVALRELGKHPRLESLTLSNCPIGDEDVEHLANCVRLQYLSLEQTNVGDVGVSRLAACGSLLKLVLHSTRATDRCLQALRSMDNQVQIEAERTEISRAALDRFHRRKDPVKKPMPLPNLESNTIQVWR